MTSCSDSPARGSLLASPRVRGEAGLHRRCNPGEGGSPLGPVPVAAPHPNPLPVKNGERERTGIAAPLSVLNPHGEEPAAWRASRTMRPQCVN
ncbi:hypothetical protein SSBR45G_08910 [Bradyrhizobium sp. SSBR45G]|nr:hypothetical protein SSBR45G_08910 [Bradyrhizobium sp. SSBR45G]